MSSGTLVLIDRTTEDSWSGSVVGRADRPPRSSGRSGCCHKRPGRGVLSQISRKFVLLVTSGYILVVSEELAPPGGTEMNLHEIEEMEFGRDGGLWDAGEGVCCAAFQLGACSHTEGAQYEYEDEVEEATIVTVPAVRTESEEPF